MGAAEDRGARPLELVAAMFNLIHELHELGYRRIRVWPGMAPSGMHWRCAVSTADNVDPQDDAQAFADWGEDRVFRYTSGMGLVPYTAQGFLAAFPRIAELGRGEDAAYAAWFEELRARSAEGYVPVGYADYPMATGVITLMPFARGLEEATFPLAPLPAP